jgi:catechol 2,3-dioxygenase-like lactoylglutathione lyase family enzyme
VSPDGERSPSVTSIEHVLVLSDDVDATRDFYCDVVGLEVGERPALEFGGYWLYAGSTPVVHIADRRAYAAHAAGLGMSVPESDPGIGPVDHVAFVATDYDAVIERIERNGVASVRLAGVGRPRQVFIEDPNGVRVEINVRS